MAQTLQGGITVKTLFVDPEFTALPKNDQIGIIKDVDSDYAALGDTDQFQIYEEMRRQFNPNFFERFADTALESGTGGLVDTQENEVRSFADGAAEVLGGIAGGVANAGIGAGVGALLGGSVVPVVGAPLGAYLGQAAGQGLGAFGQTLRDQTDAGEQANYLQAVLEGLGAAGGALVAPGAGGFVKRALTGGLVQGGITGATDVLAQASTGKFDPVRTLQRSAMGFGGGLLGAALPGSGEGLTPSGRVRKRLAEVQALQRQQRSVQMAQTVPTLPGQTIRPQYDGSLQSGLKQYSQGKPLQAYAQQVVTNSAPDPRLEQMNAYIANNLNNPAVQAFRPEEIRARALLEAAAKAETVLKQTYEQGVQALKEGRLNEFALHRSAIKQAIKKQPPEIKKLSAQALDALDEFKAKLKEQELAARAIQKKVVKSGQAFNPAILLEAPVKTKLEARAELKAAREDFANAIQPGNPAADLNAYEVMQELGFKTKKVNTKTGIGFKVNFLGKVRTIGEKETISGFVNRMKDTGQDPTAAIVGRANSEGRLSAITGYQDYNRALLPDGVNGVYSDEMGAVAAQKQELEFEAEMQVKEKNVVAKGNKLLNRLDEVTTQEELDQILNEVETIQEAMPETYWAVFTHKVEQAAEAISEDIAPTPKVLLEAEAPLWPEYSKRLELQPKGRPDLNRLVKFDAASPAAQLEASVKAAGFKDLSDAQAWYAANDFDLRKRDKNVPEEVVQNLLKLSADEREVLRTIFDPETGIGLQRDPIKEKERLGWVAWDSPEYKAAKSKLPADKQEALDQVEYAAQIDGTIVMSYAAEGGKSGKGGATSAREGKFREAVTPLFAKIDSKGDIGILSYNQEGQIATYLAQDTNGNGSEFLGKVSISGVKAFRGTYPNPLYGQRTYELADVLGKGIREQGIKTSDVEKILSQANQFGAALPKELGEAIKRNPSIPNVRLVNEFLTGLQKTPNVNKAFAALLDEAEQTGKISQMRLQQLKQELGKNKNINDLAELCQLFNLEVTD